MKRDRGIYRPALALPVPIPGSSPVLLLDVGANVTCRPEHLVQFAHMGSAFAKVDHGHPVARAWPCSPTARSRRRGRPTCSTFTSSWPEPVAPG